MNQISDQELEEFRKSGFMTTHMAMEANLVKYDNERHGKPMSADMGAMVAMLNKITEAVDLFNIEVWLMWLYSRQAMETEHRYLEANAANVNLLVGSMAGRVMITLRWRDRGEEKMHEYVSLIGAEKLTFYPLGTKNENNQIHGLCGWQGIGMNGDSAAELIREAARVSKDLANDIRKAPDSVTFG